MHFLIITYAFNAFTFFVTGLKNGVLTEQWYLTGVLYHWKFNQKLVEIQDHIFLTEDKCIF